MRRTAEGSDEQRIRKGNRLQRRANALCRARQLGAFGVAAFNLFNPYGRTLAAASVVAAIYVTDKLDGIEARRAAKLLRRPTTPEGKRLDQTVDKQAHNSIAGSQAVYAFMRGQWLFGSVILGNLAIQCWRDSIVNDKRQLAEDVARVTGVPIHTGSIPSSQKKLAAQAGADIGTQSPLAELRGGRAALGIAHFACTGLAIKSGAEVLDRLNAGIQGGLNLLPQYDPHDPHNNELRPDPEDTQTWQELALRAQPSRSERLLGRAACLLGY